MPRPKKVAKNAEEAGQLADELIKAQSGNNMVQDEIHDDSLPDDSEIPLDETPEDEDEFNLDKLNEEIPGLETPSPDDWEHKYQVLQGKYNTEIPRLSDMLSKQMEDNQKLTARIEALEQRRQPELDDSQGAGETSDDDLKTLAEQYPALYKGILAAAKQEASKASKKVEGKVDTIARDYQAERKLKYYKDLTDSVPNWEKINAHPVFIKWLNERDRYSGQTKQNLLNNAFNGNDVSTTVTFFTDFMKEKGIRNSNSQVRDADEIAPSGSSAGTGGRIVRPGLTTITRAVIDKFYSDRARGRFSGTEEEARKFEARIMQAVRDGKVK